LSRYKGVSEEIRLKTAPYLDPLTSEEKLQKPILSAIRELSSLLWRPPDVQPGEERFVRASMRELAVFEGFLVLLDEGLAKN